MEERGAQPLEESKLHFKILAPKGWHEAFCILRAQKYQVLPYKGLSPRLPGASPGVCASLG